MFQTFSGNSRRPRQVNLSGRTANPFAAVGSGAGTQSALASAQQDRQHRQRERERLQASKTIQRTWRGHRARRHVKEGARIQWDETEQETVSRGGRYASEAEAHAQTERLLMFFDYRSQEDILRWRKLYQRLSQAFSQGRIAFKGPWPMAYLRLQKVTLTALARTADFNPYKVRITRLGTGPASSTSAAGEDQIELLQILVGLIKAIPQFTAREMARRYYEVMTTLFQTHLSAAESGSVDIALWLDVLTAPLKQISADTPIAYAAFACVFLAVVGMTPAMLRPSSQPQSSFLYFLADQINYKLLANALAEEVRLSYDSTERQSTDYPQMQNSVNRLRLLGYFIFFHRHAHNFQDAQTYSSNRDFIKVVSVLLSSLEDDYSYDQHSAGSGSRQNTEYFQSWLKTQLNTLVNQESVSNLLSVTQRPHNQAGDGSEVNEQDDARELATYALNLIRFFPKQGDEIRMWLYLGSATVEVPYQELGSRTMRSESRRLPAIKYFWRATQSTDVFHDVSRDPRSAIRQIVAKSSASIIGNGTYQGAGGTSESSRVKDGWRVILIFLELYTFVLKLMDDEEFFSAGDDFSTTQPATRDNALPLGEVKLLSTFLKNLGFAMYYYGSEINDQQERYASTGSLSSYFRVDDTPTTPTSAEEESKPRAPTVAGLPGITIDYVKGLVTGLIRAVYERDSRRKFLPKGHWLMISHFDMTNFIPAVVEEEGNRNRVQEEDDEDIIDTDADADADDEASLVGTGRSQHAKRMERLRRQQRQESRKRYLQSVAPRLEILQNMPFFIPFETRVQIFREFVRLDQLKRRHGFVDPDTWRVAMMQMNDPTRGNTIERHHAKIRRGQEFDDAYEAFFNLQEGLKEPIQITFVDRFGTIEAGIDGGGVTKEFLTSVTSQAFAIKNEEENVFNLFVENDQHLLHPNPSATDEIKEDLVQAGYKPGTPEFRQPVQEFLQRYEFLGRIIGKCLYEGILVDINFASFFLLKWSLFGGQGSAPRESGYRANLNDLRDLDSALYEGLLKLKNYPGDVEDFALSFTVTDPISHHPPKTVTRDLIPNGANTTVTNPNRLAYVYHMARHRLISQSAPQTNAFLKGLSSMIQPSWLSMFNQAELQTLIGGTRASISITDLRRHTQYGGVYVIGEDGLEHPVIQRFWTVMESLSDSERRAVLKFVTSTPNPPLLGFGMLNPRFSIRDAGSEEERLPSASTCVNLLKLPRYGSERVLREKLVYAVMSGAGFDLS